MEIKSLSKNVISKIRSFCCINNITHCVTELVLNSLDAKSSAIAIRINPDYFRIQIVDNGIGISRENMENIARKYCTSKCFCLEDLDKRAKMHGYKGESLWNISQVSKSVTITSKYSDCDKTFSKNISNGKHTKVELAKNRQSNGTTVTVDGIFNNLPVRQKIIKREYELEKIVSVLRSLSIINPQISFSLRNDLTGKLLLKCQKYDNIIQALISLYPDIKEDDLTVMKVRKDKVRVDTLFLKEITCDQTIQHIFVNKRPVVFPVLRKFLCQILQKGEKKGILKGNFHPLFIMNLKCPLSHYNLIYEGSNPLVEFKNFDVLEKCIEKMVSSFLGKPLKNNEIPKHENKIKSVCGASDLVGAIKGYGFKNWLREDEKQHDSEGNKCPLFLDNENKRNNFRYPERSMKNPEVFRKTLGMLKPKPLPIQICELKKERKDIVNNDLVEINCSTSTYRGNGVASVQNTFCEKSFIDPDIISGTLTGGCKNRQFIKNYQNLENKFEKLLFKKDMNATLFSNFTNSENKGKDVIMYMFLKSIEIFSSNKNDEHSEQPCGKSIDEICNTSNETIIESNVFYENIRKTKTHQMNRTISISVKVKRKRNKSPEENSNILSNVSFNCTKPKRRNIEGINKMHFHTNLRTKNKATSPFFDIRKINYDPAEYTMKRVVDKNIQTTFCDKEESEFFASKPPKKKTKYCNTYGRDPHTHSFSLERNIKQGFDEDNHHNFMSFCFKPSNEFNGLKFANNFGKEVIQNPTRTSFIFNNTEWMDNENRRFSDWNNSRLFHFERSDNDSRKNQSYTKFPIACNSEPFMFEKKTSLDDFSAMEVEKPIRHYTDDRNFPTTFRVPNLPFDKSFDFENLSVSPVPTFSVISDQIAISKQFRFADGNCPKTIKQEKFPFKKMVTEGHIPYTYNKTYRNEKRLKIEKYSSFQLSKVSTEPITDPRSFHIEKVKQNLDKLFAKPKSVLLHNDQWNASKEETNGEIFSRDSLENITKTNTLNEKVILWKKFIEKKRNQQNVKDNFDENSRNKKLLHPIKSSKIYCDKKHTMFLKHTNILSSGKTNNLVSPDLFSETRLNDEVRAQTNYPKTDLTFLPNSQPSYEVVTNRISPEENILLKDKTIARKESILPTLTAIRDETSHSVMTLKENIRKDFIGQTMEVDTELIGNDIDSLSLHEEKGDWRPKLDQQGNKFYFNTRTGMTSFICPKQDEGFKFKPRFEFMPKGLSPVLMYDDKVDKAISPNCRNKLHEEILKSYENELDIVKWEKYLKENDPRKFFDEIYKEKRNDYEDKVPNAYQPNSSRFMATITGEHKFSKALFDDLEIIGQLDQKFIATIDKKYRNLILFDQHAVHERIRLETLVREYDGVNTPCENITLFVIQNDIKLLKGHETYFNTIGIYFRTFKNGLTVYKVPLCLYNKVMKESKQNTWNLPKLVELLVQDILNQIKATRGILTGLPKTIHDIISLEACRGAIKFGDCLTNHEMKEHLKNLSLCLLPFQCAHGRPTLVPILNLTEIKQVQSTKPQLKRLKKI